MDIRNIAIIAHVDHGKTNLTDALLRQTGAMVEGETMDSDALELERGITIYAKNAAIVYKGTKINIVDTPGHADFGSEVERVLRSIDSVILVVDAQEGPMPQTRFVLKKSLELGLKPIVVLNKIDKAAADPARAEEQVLELFMELGATDEQADFPVVYAIGRQGVAKRKLTDEFKDLTPLLDLILEKVPVASAASFKQASDSNVAVDSNQMERSDLQDIPLRLQAFNLDYDNFLGRLAVGRIYGGSIKSGSKVFIKNPHTETRTGQISKIFVFEGVRRKEIDEAFAGDIVLIAGLPDITIGDTVTNDNTVEPLTAISVDEPTITLNFMVNSSPFGGQEGKFVTSRQIRERLEKELEVNVGLRVEFSAGDIHKVSGRGELHIAILLENMRREGYELQVSQPQAIVREENGQTMEPFEEVVIDTPQEFQGAIIEKLGKRAFQMTNIITHENTIRLILEGPTRGLLGYRNQFIIDTKGEGIIASRFIAFRPYAGAIQKRETGSMISMATGKALGFSLGNLQERGVLYIGPAVQVYEGMVIGNTSNREEMAVNPTKGKQLSNMRSSGSDEALMLVPPLELSIERGLELMSEDEFLEITPKNIRLRKQFLTENDRIRSKRKEEGK
ncbi:MAG: translational GTPase TypA [Candidatus Taylorbacteria bacterium]|nr:translational GTPase TypA [Candidatus Taylorbacteria bacterium]